MTAPQSLTSHTKPTSLRIIDVHIHPDYPAKPKGGAFQAELLTKQMDRYGVEISGILGRVYPHQTPAEVTEWNSFTIETVKAAPKRLYGLSYIDPSLPRSFVIEELDRTLSQPEIRGIKLEVDVNARDGRMDIVMEKAIQYDVPVLQHSWYINLWETSPEGHYHQAGRTEPHDVADLARRFPEAKILMAHMEGSGIRGLLDVLDCPNVWVDTSGSQPFTGTVEYAVKHLGSDHLVFGTDRLGRGLDSQLARITGAAIDETARQKILFHNAVELYRLHDLVN